MISDPFLYPDPQHCSGKYIYLQFFNLYTDKQKILNISLNNTINYHFRCNNFLQGINSKKCTSKKSNKKERKTNNIEIPYIWQDWQINKMKYQLLKIV